MKATWDNPESESEDKVDIANMWFVAQGDHTSKVCVKTLRHRRWYLDSSCLRHMMWDINNFATLSSVFEGGYVTFGDNSKRRIISFDNVKISKSPLIENILLVDGLKHNLLSIDSTCCNVIDNKDACLLTGYRKNNVYIIYMLKLDSNITCFTIINDEHWLWHRRLGHVSFDHLSRIGSKDVVKCILKLKFENDHICEAC